MIYDILKNIEIDGGSQMEEESVIKEKQGSYITGIIGAIIGGAIATIPWVLAYVYGGMMLSILAALIAAGEFYGYKLAKGKISKKARHVSSFLLYYANLAREPCQKLYQRVNKKA